MAKTYEYLIDSVENAAKTLLMLRNRRSIRAAEVASELGVARSTAHRMVSTLAQAGLLRRNEADKSYSAGYALSELAMAVIGVADIRTEIQPALAQIASQTGETVHFLVRDADEVIFVAVAEGNYVIRAASRVGTHLPAHLTSAGKCLLAVLPRKDLLALYPSDRRLSGGTGSAIRGRTELLREIESVAGQGYAMNHAESEPGLTAISRVVHDSRGVAIGAISISGPSDRIESRVSHLVDVLQTNVESVESTLAGAAPS